MKTTSNSDDTALLIVDPHNLAGALETMPKTEGLRIITTEQLIDGNLRLHQDRKICITADPELEEVMPRLEDQSRLFAIRKLKDKFGFRELLSSIYPDLKYRTIRLHDLPNECFNRGTKYILKPVKGCFGTGVRTIVDGTDLTRLVDEIEREIAMNSAVLSKAAFSADDFLVETFIEGEEYAIDMFYDNRGRPLITNIYHHPMPANPAYLHMLYYCSRDVFTRIDRLAKNFFTSLNTFLNVKNCPIHGEFRLQEGQLVPIELNPLRFGGAGLANLGFYAFGVNAYRCFVDDCEPRWNEIWRDKPGKIYGFFIAYNGSTVDLSTHEPNWTRLRRLFADILFEVSFNYRKQLAFGVVYFADQPSSVPRILETEFDDLFIPCALAAGPSNA